MKTKTCAAGLALTLLLTACDEPVAEVSPFAGTPSPRSAAPKPFSGGFFEASGVVHVAHAAAILFVDDNRPGEIAWMKLDSAGAPVGEVQLSPLGVEVQDPEDITFDGQYYYVVGSQFAKKSGRKVGLVRFKFDAASGKVSDVESTAGLRDLLVTRVPSLPDLDAPGAKDGLNIEGLAWHPGESALLLGLRSPRVGADAVILKLKFRDPSAPLAVENLEVAGPPLRLALDGVGIRGLAHDAIADRLLIIAGPTEKQGNRPFALWEWLNDRPRRLAYLDARLKPEGLSRRGDALVIVCDASWHLTMPAP